MVVLLFYFFKKVRLSTIKKEQKWIVYSLIGYIFFAALSNMFAGYKAISGLLFNILSPLFPLTMVMWCEYLKRKYGSLSYNIIYTLLLFYVVLNIMTMILVPEGFVELDQSKYGDVDISMERTYFIGGKFSTAYFNVIFATFFLYVNRTFLKMGIVKEKIIMALFFTYAIASAVIMKGMTAATVVIFFAVFYFVWLPTKLFKSPTLILGFVVAISMVLLFFQDYLLQNNVYLYIVQDVMGKDSHMTGRLDIYYRLSQYLLEHGGLIGVGTSYDFLEQIGAGNLQNELFQKLFQTGIGGVFFFFLYLYLNMKYARYDKISQYWFVSLVAFMLASLVEVPFGGAFFIFTAMMPKKFESLGAQQITIRR